MINNVHKLTMQDREFLISYLDKIRYNQTDIQEIQHAYYYTLRECLGVNSNSSNISLDDINNFCEGNKDYLFEFIVEYFIIGGGSFFELLSETELYDDYDNLEKIFSRISEKVSDSENLELLYLQYTKDRNYMADELLFDEMSDRFDELTDLHNDLIDQISELQSSIWDMEEEIIAKKELLHSKKRLEADISDKKDRVFSRIGRESERIAKKVRELFSEDYDAKENIYEENEDDYSIVKLKVFATMSAGKSTFINSLLGMKIMPSANMACTAKVTRIIPNNNLSVKTFSEDGELLLEQENITYRDMQFINGDDSVDYVRVEAPIEFSTSEGIEVNIIDTPGPNNSRDDRHSKIAKRELASLNEDTIAIYIINATQFGIEDDAKFLDDLYEASYVDRVMFLVNKVDEVNSNEENIQKLLDNIKEYLSEHNFYGAEVYPISALTALNIETILQTDSVDEDNDDVFETRRLMRKLNRNNDLHLEKYPDFSESIQSQLESKLKKAEENDDKKMQALIHSGIEGIKAAILEKSKEIIDHNLNNDYWE